MADGGVGVDPATGAAALTFAATNGYQYRLL